MSGTTVALLTVTSPPAPPQGITAYSAALAAALASAPGGVASFAAHEPDASPPAISLWGQRVAGSPVPAGVRPHRARDTGPTARMVSVATPGTAGSPLHGGGRPGGGPPEVLPVWRPGLPAGPDVVAQVHASRPRILHVQVEFGIYGGAVGLASLLCGLAVARLRYRPRVVVTLHQVPSPRELTGAWLRRAGVRLPAWMARAGIRSVLAAFVRLSDEVLVHAEVFRERLRAEWGLTRPIRVVPHGVTPAARPARHREMRLLVFGYLKWYKGVEIALEAFRQLADEFPGWTLTVAGPSAAPRYLQTLREMAAPLGSRVQFLGRVDEPTADELFARAGVVLFPYRTLFAASGPLARAIGAAAPFVISDVLRPLAPDWPYRAPLDPAVWTAVLRPLLREPGVREAAADRAAALARSAAWGSVAAQTRTIYESMLS